MAVVEFGAHRRNLLNSTTAQKTARTCRQPLCHLASCSGRTQQHQSPDCMCMKCGQSSGRWHQTTANCCERTRSKLRYGSGRVEERTCTCPPARAASKSRSPAAMQIHVDTALYTGAVVAATQRWKVHCIDMTKRWSACAMLAGLGIARQPLGYAPHAHAMHHESLLMQQQLACCCPAFRECSQLVTLLCSTVQR